MKASKEALVGLMAAIDHRLHRDASAWVLNSAGKSTGFAARAGRLRRVEATLVPDPAGSPFERIRLQIDPARASFDAASLARALRESAPAIWTMGHEIAKGALLFELVPLDDDEVGAILYRLSALLGEVSASGDPRPAVHPRLAPVVHFDAANRRHRP